MMDRWFLRGVAIGALLAALPAVAMGQARLGTVQLPTFNFFTVNTTVEVPDSGGGVLGGVDSAASGCNQRGIPGLGSRPFTNVAGGARGAAGSVSVTAEIHDFEAMDRQLLGNDFDRTADATTAADALAVRRLPIMLRPVVGAKSLQPSALAADSTGASSIAEIHRQQAAEDSAAEQQAQRLFDQAAELQSAGKSGVAKVYYQMAARRTADGDLKQRALAAVRELSRPTPSVSAGRNSPPP
jgi:hypothetical protein